MPAAARVGDPTGHPGVVGPPGEPTVLIGGRPAARVGDTAGCGASITSGCPSVLIGG
ncbi:PAAR domain-containing protein [Streptomyces melanosporofaciens]|uniref:PAAR domain-containing protein n=1 Tax=Streptomyces melanosporofaciens TaxID=67327 RepID=UPI000B80D9FA|nr:PAAR domain-containing protein [Streptomyces melanosporofaciens]